MKGLRTWVEIDSAALRSNAESFLSLLSPRTRLMAVIKSNAYGHGLVQTAKLLTALNPKPSILNPRLWFGVDSIVEASRLRREGIKNSILVLGHTLPSRVSEAAAKNITLTISNFEALAALAAQKKRPAFHLKIDTGMHRQGFLPHEMAELVVVLKQENLVPKGVYTHFASAKDSADHEYTRNQIRVFETTSAGFPGVIRHAAATGGAFLFPESHYDMVRIGMGLYGYPPSRESRSRIQELEIRLKPVLSWKTIVGEVKEVPSGSRIGYDETETVRRRTKIAVTPIGYWHGYDRGLSSIGKALVRGISAKVLGRVSMDMVVIDVTAVPDVKVGDEVVLIGAQGGRAIGADEMAGDIGTTPYEVLTRINPLIRRIQV